MSPGLAPALLAEKCKEEGNSYFKKQLYGAAVDAYTQAITLCPNVAVYWTNRALCYRRRGDWKRVEEDCRRAIQLDHHSVKGHYMLGLALIQGEYYAEGIKNLERALDLERSSTNYGRSSMVESIWQELSRAKYLLWEHESTKRSWELQILREACEAALKEKHFLDDSEMEGFIDERIASNQQQLETLGKVFARAAEKDTPVEVPDFLCCKITLDVFRDPVITPSGITYEREAILKHLENIGYFDPVTRGPLKPSDLVCNLAIREAVSAYLDRHGWAYNMN